MTDQGCMFRGYGRGVVDAVNQCSEYNTFVPALAYTFAREPDRESRWRTRSAAPASRSIRCSA